MTSCSEWSSTVSLGPKSCAGVPHEEIVAAAEKHEANLIVMGSTGLQRPIASSMLAVNG